MAEPAVRVPMVALNPLLRHARDTNRIPTFDLLIKALFFRCIKRTFQPNSTISSTIPPVRLEMAAMRKVKGQRGIRWEARVRKSNTPC